MSIVEKRPEDVTKLLIAGNHRISPQRLSFICGQVGVYVEHLLPLENNRAIATVHYHNASQVDALLLSVKTMSVWRIFKSAPLSLAKRTDKTKPQQPQDSKTPQLKPLTQAFVDRTVVNALSLLKGRTLRIMADDKELRKRFYDSAVKLNSEGDFKCTFDFEKYDVGFTIKIFRRLQLRRGREQYYVVVYTDRPITPLLPIAQVH
jgi:hypothetical protein